MKHPVDDLLCGNKNKKSHKLTSHKLLSIPNLQSWAKNNNIIFNVFHNQKWEADQGAVLWQRAIDTKEAFNGYVAQDKKGRALIPIALIKHKKWRLHPDRSLTEADLVKIEIPKRAASKLSTIESGRETEVMVLPKGLDHENLVVPFNQAETTLSVDLLKATTEFAFGHEINTQSIAKQALEASKWLVLEAQNQTQRVVPLSFHPYQLELEDTQPNLYVQNFMQTLQWENKVELYAGCHTIQFHIDNTNLTAALIAYNLLQQVTPLLMSLSLAGPFGYGQECPNMKRILQTAGINLPKDISTILDHPHPLSIRQAAKTFGSPSGGVNPTTLPIESSSFFKVAEEQVLHGTIPSIDRVGGHHRDIRLRAILGTGELGVCDTFAGNPYKEASMQELARVLWWKLQHASPKSLKQKHPRLFTDSFMRNPIKYEEVNLHNLLLNSLSLSIRGIGETSNDTTYVYGADGVNYPAQSLIDELISFVNQPLEDFVCLPKRILMEINNCNKIPTSKDFATGCDYIRLQPLPSLNGYYQTGIGTPSHWIRARANVLKKVGSSPKQVLDSCLSDVASSYRKTILAINSTDLAVLFDRGTEITSRYPRLKPWH
jgi:5-formyltetrahydrofolate cyclo-ligase